MKNFFIRIGNMISTFFTTHTAVAITTAIAVVVVAVAVPVGIHIANNPEDDPPTVETSETTGAVLDNTPETENSTTALETESDGPETDVVSETTGIETSVATEPDETIAEPVITTGPEPVATEPTVIVPVVTTPVPVETNPPVPVVTEPPAPVVTEPIVTTPSEPTPVVKQRADLTTGISWDGVSPIIYTYSDGTTGTEIRVGATYEVVPGMTNTVDESHMPNWEPDTDEYNGLCTHCGKKGGDGSNGTCLRYWTGGDHICANCGVIVPQSTCHTCNH